MLSFRSFVQRGECPTAKFLMFMVTTRTQKPKPDRSLARLMGVLSLLIFAGCRQHAYTELYVDNMAGEIRALEDRIYEYDAAYQASEAELEEQILVNQALEEKLRKLKASSGLESRSGSPHKDPPSILVEPEPIQIPPKSKTQSGQLVLPAVPESQSPPAIENAPSVMRVPAKPPSQPEEVLPATPDPSNRLPNSEGGTPGSNTEALPPKEPRAQNQKSHRDLGVSKDSLVEQVVVPESLVRSAQQPKLLVTPPQPGGLTPEIPGSNKSNAPPSLLPKALQNLPFNDQGSIKKHQIRLPEGSRVQLASALEPSIEKAKSNDVTDKRIIEIGFHPTLCRGHNFDQNPGDDGVYLVMTPLNAEGQTVNETAKLTVVVEDEAIQENKGRIIARQYSPSELKEMLTPIGTSQGFHLSIPWENAKPASNQVIVYAKYEFEDGRSLVNHRIVQLRTPNRASAVWTPRQ